MRAGAPAAGRREPRQGPSLFLLPPPSRLRPSLLAGPSRRRPDSPRTRPRVPAARPPLPPSPARCAAGPAALRFPRGAALSTREPRPARVLPPASSERHTLPRGWATVRAVASSAARPLSGPLPPAPAAPTAPPPPLPPAVKDAGRAAAHTPGPRSPRLDVGGPGRSAVPPEADPRPPHTAVGSGGLCPRGYPPPSQRARPDCACAFGAQSGGGGCQELLTPVGCVEF